MEQREMIDTLPPSGASDCSTAGVGGARSVSDLHMSCPIHGMTGVLSLNVHRGVYLNCGCIWRQEVGRFIHDHD